MAEKYPIAEFFKRMLIFPFSAISDDGSRVAYVSSISGTPQFWVGEIPPSGLMSYPKQLTSDRKHRAYVFDESAIWIGQNKLACLFDTEGDEMTFIEVFDLATGDRVPVPRIEKKARDFLGFGSEDGKTLYFRSNRDNPQAQGLFSFSLKDGSVVRHYQHEKYSATWYDGLSFKGHFLFHLGISNTESRLMGVNPKTGGVLTVFDKPDCNISAIRVLDEERVLVNADSGREFSSPAVLHVKSGKLDYLFKDEWDKDAILSRDRKHLLLSENNAGRSILSLYDFKSGAKPSLRKKALGFSEKGVIDQIQFSRNCKFALIAYQSPTEPRDLYRLDLKTRKIQRLTDNYNSLIPQRTLVDPKLVNYKSEEREIYSWLFVPKGAKPSSSLPVIIWPHGGPQSQERAQQRPIFQYFLSRGFAIWAPNHSGSTGFGRECVKAINQRWGTADLPDMKNGIEWLKKSGWINPRKMVIMGGSYGGYMTLRSITRMPDVFKAAVDIFGVSNLLSFLETVPVDWRPYMDEMVGNLERDRERLREQSPAFELDRIRCPLLVAQGAKDPRVVKDESDQVVESLRQRGHPVEYMVFDDEGHGFFNLENELKFYRRAAEFIEEQLGISEKT